MNIRDTGTYATTSTNQSESLETYLVHLLAILYPHCFTEKLT